ncbi:MAG TPA: 2-oxo acid dehydrogenase subunit E2 [Streptosporangiaceae bacterium]|nr:2-oxo acid dehydrogenase subunit E2 [Streptosporangiaceae bacterium]
MTPAHLVGRGAAKVVEALPGLNGRVVFGSFVPSPTIDGFFVVSLRTDPVAGTEAARRAKMIRGDRDPQFKQAKTMVQNLPPMVLRVVLDTIGLVTETLQLPVPFMGLEARPYGSFLVSNVGTFGLDSAFAPVPPFVHVPVIIMVGAVTDKAVARGGQPVVRPMLPLCVSLDHRFVDGYQAASMARIFRSTWPIRPGTTRYPRRGRRPCHRGRRSCPRDARRPPGCSGGDHGAQAFPEVLLEVGDLAHRLGGGTRKRVEHLSPRVSPSGIPGGHRAPRRG